MPPGQMIYKKVVDNADKLCRNNRNNRNKLCGNQFESTWAPGPELIVCGRAADCDDWGRG